MEAIRIDSNVLRNSDEYFEIKVRARENDYAYYVFPKPIVEKALYWLKNSDIYYDAVRTDSEVMEKLFVEDSKYSTDGYSESECIALESDVDINDLYELIEYIEQHPQAKFLVELYKNSELPEFQDLLNDQFKEQYSPEIQVLLIEYMKTMLDMKASDRMYKIIDYMEKASFAKLLKSYSVNVVEYILSNVTKRLAEELREEMAADE